MTKEPKEKLTEILLTRITKTAMHKLEAEMQAAGYSSKAEYVRVEKLNGETTTKKTSQRFED